tara:strand:+ start:393 stop:551 length:159 start_codon:yes stop_codon:yes gene_type:complete
MEAIGFLCGALMLYGSYLWCFNPANRITSDKEDLKRSEKWLQEKGLWGNPEE